MTPAFSPPAAAARRPALIDALLLGGGLALFAVSNGRWVVPVASWLAPALLLAWTRRRSPAVGLVALAALLAGINTLAWSGTADPEWLPAALGPVVAAVYLVDRLVAPRLGPGILASLPFPLAYTVLDLAISRISPLGSIGAVGATQVEQIALVQLAAVTGTWGITFLVSWFAPVAVGVAMHRERARFASIAFAATLAGVLVLGGLRIATAPPASASIRVAGVTLLDRVLARELWDAEDRDPAAFDRLNAAIRRHAEEVTRREAAAGADIVLFSEGSIKASADEAASLEAWGATLAREARTTLVVPVYLVSREPGGLDENALVMFAPDGRVVLRHRKFGSAMLEGIIPGSGVLQFVEVTGARVGAVICRDLDFPAVIQQAGAAGADLVLAPSFDWAEIDPFHTRYAVLRAVENGFALVRQTADGLSIAVDPYGRTLAAMDHFASRDRVLVADVPLAGTATPYGRLGDWFGWAAVAGLLAVALRAVLAGRQRPPA